MTQTRATRVKEAMLEAWDFIFQYELEKLIPVVALILWFILR